MNHHRAGMQLLDYVNELTRTHTHREHYSTKVGHTTYGRDHVTAVPPLLHQLRYASPSGMGEERANLGFESRPAASLEALDTLTRIEHQATEWLGLLDENIRTSQIRGWGLDRLLQRIGGLHAGLTDIGVRRDLERDVRRWWAQARVISGWDTPAWRPENSCPMCGERGSLRVKFADKVGMCTECRETWSEATIGLLADHIREESAAERPELVLTACWCAWPRPPFTFDGKWGALCPSCGSHSCQRAVPATRRRAG